MIRRAAVIAAALAVISGCVAVAAEPVGMITGTVTYLQKSALPPNATVVVRLEDVSLIDVPVMLISEVKAPTAGQQVPIAFQLPYDSGKINPAHHYQVRALIEEAGRMLFRSTAGYPVITAGAPTQVTIVVQSVGAADSGGGEGEPAARLEETYWKLVEVANDPVSLDPGQGEPHLMLRSGGKLTGFGGCNRLLGSFEVAEASLHLKPLGATMMACAPPVMKRERALLDALEDTKTYRIHGATLELRDGERVLARFQVKETQ